MPGSKAWNHDVLAQEWFYGLMTRPDMSIKVERKLHDMRILGRIVEVRSTKQSVRHLLTLISHDDDIRVKRSCFFMLAWKKHDLLTRKHRKVAFFRRKWADLRCFRIARAWNAKQSVYHRNQNIFWPQHHFTLLFYNETEKYSSTKIGQRQLWHRL